MLVRALAVCVLALAAAAAPAAEEFTFDATEFQKKPLELGGYVELKQQHFTLNPDGALYLLNFYREPRSYLDDTTLTLKPSGVLRRGAVSLNFRAHLEGDWETRGFDRLARFDEFYGSYKPDPGFTLNAGKVSLKWGKGYAWNPVAFVERVKDPNDPDLAREGFTLLTADWIRNFDGALRTVAFTPVVLPASPDINPDFGAGRHLNAAAKLYLLYRDTDIDFMILSNGSRSRRYGADFSRNITSNLEIHGELARIEDTQRQVTTAAGQATLVRGAATSYLLGARHLSERDTTTVLEYYRNGPGLSEDEMKNFVRFVDSAYAQYLATGNDAAASSPSDRRTDWPARKRRRCVRGVCRCSSRMSSPRDETDLTRASSVCSGMSAAPCASRASITRSVSAVWQHMSTTPAAFSAAVGAQSEWRMRCTCPETTRALHLPQLPTLQP